MECYFKWNVIQTEMLIKLERHLIKMSLKLECPLNRYITQIQMHLNLKTKKIEKVVIPQTSTSASID